MILDSEERDQALAWGRQQGLPVELLTSRDLLGKEPGLGLQLPTAIRMPEVAQIRNPRLVKALRRSIEGRIQIREQEEVIELLVSAGRMVAARTPQDIIPASLVVVCAGAWTAKLLEQLGNRPAIEPVRGQMILFHAKPGLVNHIVLFRERYLIPRRDGRILIGSTLEHEGFVQTTTAEAKEELYRAAVEIFPVLKRTPIESRWAGLRPGSPRGIPYIGAYPGIQGLYYNAGDYRNGLVTGPASARLAADMVLGREPLCDPAPYALDARR